MATVVLANVTWSQVDSVVLKGVGLSSSNTLYGDQGNGVAADDAATAIKGAFDSKVGSEINTFQQFDLDNLGKNCQSVFYNSLSQNTPVASGQGYSICLAVGDVANDRGLQVASSSFGGQNSFWYRQNLGSWTSWFEFLSSGNTTVDGSGFVKEASPIVKLFSDKIEKNNQVDESVSLTINGVGDYTITGSEGFAKEGWYIENPKDANGNVKHFIEYTQDADGTINVKVYEPDYSLGYIQAGAPCNVVYGRWIDIRLHKTGEVE